MTIRSSSCWRGRGKPESNCRAVVRDTLDRDRAAMESQNGFDNGQPQSHPWVVVRARRVDPIEAIKNLWEMFGSDANTRVSDTDEDGVILCRCDRQGYRAP